MYKRAEISNLTLPFIFKGTVIHGKGMGKKLGFPTANLNVMEEDCSRIYELNEGIYYGTCTITSQPSSSLQNMVMSMGLNPTFNDRSVEVHILKEYTNDFYDETLVVNVVGFIRPMKKFDTLDELIEAIRRDIEVAQQLGYKKTH